MVVGLVIPHSVDSGKEPADVEEAAGGDRRRLGVGSVLARAEEVQG